MVKCLPVIRALIPDASCINFSSFQGAHLSAHAENESDFKRGQDVTLALAFIKHIYSSLMYFSTVLSHWRIFPILLVVGEGCRWAMEHRSALSIINSSIVKYALPMGISALEWSCHKDEIHKRRLLLAVEATAGRQQFTYLCCWSMIVPVRQQKWQLWLSNVTEFRTIGCTIFCVSGLMDKTSLKLCFTFCNGSYWQCNIDGNCSAISCSWFF